MEKVIFKFLLLLLGFENVISYIEAVKFRPLNLTKTECESLDTEVVRFNECAVVKEDNKRPALNLYVQIMEKLNSMVINVKLFRKSNKTYQPMLYDDVIDLCRLFQSGGTSHLFWGTFFNKLGKFTNMNHTCPYEHDIIVKQLVFDDNVFQIFPMPRGQYMVQFNFIVNGIRACKIEIFCNRA